MALPMTPPPVTEPIAVPRRRTAPPQGQPEKQRSLWADAIKGFCIVLVVVWHVIWMHLMADGVDRGVQLPVVDAWYALGNALMPMRMPMFFALSGVFASAAVTRPWRTVARSRIAKFSYLYVLWLLIHNAVLWVLPVRFEDRAPSVLALLEQLTITPTTTWYLYALVVYFVIAKLLHRAPAPLVVAVLVVTFGLSAASSAGWQDMMAGSSGMVGQRDAVVENLPWFLCGVWFRSHIVALAERTSWPRVLITGSVWVLVLVAIRFFDLSMVPGTWPVAGAVSTVFGITALAMAARWLPLGRLLAAIGRRVKAVLDPKGILNPGRMHAGA